MPLLGIGGGDGLPSTSLRYLHAAIGHQEFKESALNRSREPIAAANDADCALVVAGLILEAAQAFAPRLHGELRLGQQSNTVAFFQNRSRHGQRTGFDDDVRPF